MVCCLRVFAKPPLTRRATDLAPPPPPSSGLSFAQGFVLGQLSICIVLFAFIKFFIFGDVPSPSARSSTATAITITTNSGSGGSSSSSSSNDRLLPPPPSSPAPSPIVRPPPPLSPRTILRKTYASRPAAESLAWFNVLAAQALAQLRRDAAADGAVLTSLTALLNGPGKPAFVADIAVTEMALGEDFPAFSNCRVHEVAGGLEARMDVELGGGGGGGGDGIATLGIETALVLNYPRPRAAVLPVALSVGVVRFAGTLAVSFVPAGGPGPAAALAFAFLPDYALALSTRSLFGARSRLQDVPKIAQLVEARLRAWFDERCVQPRAQRVVVPSPWPASRTGAGAGADVAGGEKKEEEEEEGRRKEAVGGAGDPVAPAGIVAGHDEADATAGPRRRHGPGFGMPGAMPGMVVS